VSAVRQDSEPSLIGRSLASTHASNCRVSQPAKRSGYMGIAQSDTTKRGKEPFVSVRWEEALDIAAEALVAAKRKEVRSVLALMCRSESERRRVISIPSFSKSIEGTKSSNYKD